MSNTTLPGTPAPIVWQRRAFAEFLGSAVVAENHLSEQDRIDRGSFAGCVAGALSHQEYLETLADSGFAAISLEYTHEVAPEMHGATVKAVKPAASYPVV